MPMEKRFVAYYRVSSQQQGRSGLGLEAQRSAVMNYVQNNGNKIIAEYTEKESGRNNDRPQLKQAINKSIEENATLVIAKLDRLARDVEFIFSLKNRLEKANISFVALDLPDVDNIIALGTWASFAQWESQRISQRTKDALAAKKKREPDWKPGTPENLTPEAVKKAWEARRHKADHSQQNRHAWHYIKELRADGYSFAKIAEELNKEGYRTRTDKKFKAMSVYNIYKRFNKEKGGRR